MKIGNSSNINYSVALLELCIDNGNIDSIYSDILFINDTLKNNDIVLKSLKIPFINPEKKMDIFFNIFKDYLKEDILVNFFRLLFNRYKINEFIDILDKFEKLVFKEKGKVKIEIRSVDKLKETQLKEIVFKLGLDYNNVIFDQKIEKKLIGGFILMYDNKIYDASIKSRLLDIKNNIRF